MSNVENFITELKDKLEEEQVKSQSPAIGILTVITFIINTIAEILIGATLLYLSIKFQAGLIAYIMSGVYLASLILGKLLTIALAVMVKR